MNPSSMLEERMRVKKKWAGDFSTDPAKGFRVEHINYGKAEHQVIHFEGVGKVKIGSSKAVIGEYNHLSIELDPIITEEEAGAKLNIIFAALGLGSAVSKPRSEDTDRIKIMQLFRAYYPREAFAFERDDTTFNESIESLKGRIEELVPPMRRQFQLLTDKLKLMYQQEVYPGKSIWAVSGYADEMRKAGAMGLVAGIAADNLDDLRQRVVSMLRIGALSIQDRFSAGILAAGASSAADIGLGGSDSVFARMITKNMEPDIIDHMPLRGKIQILYSLDLLERGGYGYMKDEWGSKEEATYKKRNSLLEMAEKLANDPLPDLDNEVCIKNRIPPQFIKGIRVENDKEKAKLIAVLKEEGLITQNASQQDGINGIPIDQFIRVGDVKPEYWT